jgi:hypothetical protein
MDPVTYCTHMQMKCTPILRAHLCTGQFVASKIVLGLSIPNIPLRRYNPGELEEIQLQVANMLKQKIIRPITLWVPYIYDKKDDRGIPDVFGL